MKNYNPDQSLLMIEYEENQNISSRNSDSSLKKPVPHQTIKELYFLLQHNCIFRYHTKEQTNARLIKICNNHILAQSVPLIDISDIDVSMKEDIDIKSYKIKNAKKSYLPSPITRDYLYIALSSSRPKSNLFQDSRYVIEFGWDTFFNILEINNEWNNRVFVRDRLEELTRCHISHNFSKEGLSKKFWYCNKIFTDLSKDGGLQLYFDNFRNSFDNGLIFTIPLSTYLSIKNVFAKSIFTFLFCYLNPRNEGYKEYNTNLRDFIIRLGKTDWLKLPKSHLIRAFTDNIFPAISELSKKDLFYCVYDGKEAPNYKSLSLDTILSFTNGSQRMPLYTKTFMNSPASNSNNFKSF